MSPRNAFSRLRIAVLGRLGRGVIFGPAARLVQWRKRAELARGLDPHVATMIALGEITGDADMTGGPVEAVRTSMREGVLLADAPLDAPVRTEAKQVAGDGVQLNARLYVPEHAGGDSSALMPGLVFIHGGGWVTGDLDTHDALCRKLAHFGRMRVLAIEPRLAPEHRFPVPYNDALCAFRDVASRAATFGIDAARLGVGGDSAGGNLSAGVGLATRGDARRPALTLLIYPACDATWSMPSIRENAKGLILHEDSLRWYLNHYVGQIDPPEQVRKDPRLSPLWADGVDGAPPALSVIAGFDPLRDEGLAYAKKLQDAGIVSEVQNCPSLTHGFALYTGLSEAARTETERFCIHTGELLRRFGEQAS